MNKKLSNYIKIQKKWSEIGQHKPIKQLEANLSFYKKMLNVFQVGPFYYFIFYPSKSYLELISDSFKDILGYENEIFTTEKLFKIIHPDDIPTFMDYEEKVVEFKMNLPKEKLSKYKSQYYYRIRKADGNYLPILQQSVTIQYDEEGAVLRNLVIHTDISTLNPSFTKPSSLSFLGLEGEPSFLNAHLNSPNDTKDKSLLTKREKEIVVLLCNNKTTESISKELFISPHTVATHRKNILAKTQTKNVLELAMKVIEKGWLCILLYTFREGIFMNNLIENFTTI